MPYNLPISAPQLVAALTRMVPDVAALTLLNVADARIEHTGTQERFDDNDIDLFTLFLEVPFDELTVLGIENIRSMEKKIIEAAAVLLRGYSNLELRHVIVSPKLEDIEQGASEVRVVQDSEVSKIWEKGMMRLFISHVSKYKREVSDLKVQLKAYKISGFVAHEDIEPATEWVAQIELALGSCHALVAVMTDGFHESKFTDHEIGFALARRIPIVPLMMVQGELPYGLFARFQGMKTRGSESAPELAYKLANRLADTDAIPLDIRGLIIVGTDERLEDGGYWWPPPVTHG